MNSKLLYKNYIFLEKINDLIKENLLKFSNINIIIDINHNEIKNSESAGIVQAERSTAPTCRHP
jgi:hypothetical protein